MTTAARNAIGESYAGGVVIRQQERRTDAEAWIAVEDEANGGGWTILFDAYATPGFVPTDLFEVELPDGGHGVFAYCPEPGIPEAFGIGLGWPPTRQAP